MLVLKPRGEIVANHVRSGPRRRGEMLIDREEDGLTEGARKGERRSAGCSG
jgi:hypothetical protein